MYGGRPYCTGSIAPVVGPLGIVRMNSCQLQCRYVFTILFLLSSVFPHFKSPKAVALKVSELSQHWRDYKIDIVITILPPCSKSTLYEHCQHCDYNN